MARKFMLVEDGKKLGGVCTGLAEYFNFDVTLIRVFFVLLVLASVGIAIVAYLAMWLIAPTAPRSQTSASTHPSAPPPSLPPGS